MESVDAENSREKGINKEQQRRFKKKLFY